MTTLSPYSQMQIDHLGRVSVVRLTAKTILEERTIQTIAEELIRLVTKLGNRELLVDFREVQTLSSYMLARLMDLDKKVKAVGGRLALCNIDEEIYKVFEVTRLNRILKIYPDEAAALQSF